MAEINYGQLADAIVDAIQRSRAVGEADDPVALLSQSLTNSIDSWSDSGDKTAVNQDRAAKELRQTIAFVTNQLVKTTERLASEVLVLQRQGLAFNRDFTTTMRLSGDRIAGLPGGLKQSLESLFAFQTAGLMNTGKGTLALANTMRITGQSVQGLVQMDKMLFTQGLLSSAQRDTLVTTMATTSRAYGVAAENIVESVNALAKSMDLLGLTGGAGPMADQITKLTAQSPALGQQAAALVNSLVDAVKTGDMGQIYRLGLSEEVDKMLAGTGDLMTLISKANEGSVRAMGGIGSQGKEFVNAQMAVVGKTGFLAEQLTKSMAQNEKQTQGKSISQLGADFMTTLNEALAPFQKELGEAVTWLAKFAGGVVKFVASIVNAKVAVGALTLMIGGKMVGMIARLITAMGALGTRMGLTSAMPFVGSRGAGAARGISMLGRAGIWGLAAATVLVGMPALVTSMTQTEKNTKASAELLAKTYESQLFNRKELGRSRFEEVSKMLINQNMLAAGSSQAAFAEGQADGFANLAESNERIHSALVKDLPGRTPVDKRNTPQNRS